MIALLLNHLWQSSLCVAGAGLLALALHRNGANVRFWLWFAVSLKFLVPFALLTALGAYFLAPIVLPVAAPAVMLMEPLAKPFSAPAIVRVTTRLSAEPSAEPALPVRPAPLVRPALPERSVLPASPTTHFDLESALLALWAAGFLIIALRWLVRWSRVRVLLRGATAVQVDAPIAVKFSSSRLEPGLVGILRPVILLPQGIEQQLSSAELRAVLAHELCHWRRHDNLLAAIHMLVEALFWFFPLVWWLGARLNAERERACDESVLADGNDPEMYAEGILKVCRAYLQSPLACVAGVSGAGLKKRIDAIMENRLIPQLNAARKFVLSASAAAALVLPLMLGLAAVPVAQMQAKAAPIASLPPNAPSRADETATISANSALNEPNRNKVPSQGTTSAMAKSPPETLAAPSPDLSGVLPTENIAAPIVVASNAATANDQPAASVQPTAPGPAQASLDSPAPAKASSNEPPVVYHCRNTSVFGRVISPAAIEMQGFSCFGGTFGNNGDGINPTVEIPFGSCPHASTDPGPPFVTTGNRLGQSAYSCKFDVRMNVQLGDAADAEKMQPGKMVRLAGEFRVARKDHIDYLSVTNAKVIWVDPFDRPAAADQPAAITCQSPALNDLSKRLNHRLCVQADILANLNAKSPEIAAALNSPFLRQPFLKDFQNELAGGPDAITCRAGGRSLTCAHNSYWVSVDHRTGPRWKGGPDFSYPDGSLLPEPTLPPPSSH